MGVSKCDWRLALILSVMATACTRMESTQLAELSSLSHQCQLTSRPKLAASKTSSVHTEGSQKITVDWSAVNSETATDRQEDFFAKGMDESDLIPADSEFVVTLDRDCAENDTTFGLSHRILQSSRRRWPIQRVTLPWTLDRDLSRAEFSDLILADGCLIQISEQDHIVLNSDLSALRWQDPLSKDQGHLETIELETAHEFFYRDDGIREDVVIAVVDSGVDFTHPDLMEQMWTNSLSQHGFDFVDIDTEPLDIDGHGTHVAGLIGARANNNIGTTGVMGDHVRLMAIRALTAAGGVISGSIDSIVNGIQFAIDNGANVINLSLGGYTSNATLRRALEIAVAKNILVIAAAGNDHIDIGAGADTFFSPAGYAKDLPGVISVASIDTRTQLLSTFSNYSSLFVEIAAPGSEDSQGRDFGLLSTYPLAMSPNAAGAYQRFSGTSMAAPVVAGTVGLIHAYLKSKRVLFTAEQLERFLLLHSSKTVSLRSSVKDGTTLDLESLVAALDELIPDSSRDSDLELNCD